MEKKSEARSFRGRRSNIASDPNVFIKLLGEGFRIKLLV